jgi:hypothetical protein
MMIPSLQGAIVRSVVTESSGFVKRIRKSRLPRLVLLFGSITVSTPSLVAQRMLHRVAGSVTLSVAQTQTSEDYAERRWLEQRQRQDDRRVRVAEQIKLSSAATMSSPQTVTGVVTLLSTNFFSDSFGDLVVVGEVRNTTASTLSFTKAKFSFYNSLGSLVGSDYDFVYGSQNARLVLSGIFTSVLPPGAVGFFKVWTLIPAAEVASYSFGSQAETYATVPPRAAVSLASGVSLVPNVLGGTNYGTSVANGGSGSWLTTQGLFSRGISAASSTTWIFRT